MALTIWIIELVAAVPNILLYAFSGLSYPLPLIATGLLPSLGALVAGFVMKRMKGCTDNIDRKIRAAVIVCTALMCVATPALDYLFRANLTPATLLFFLALY